MGVEPKMAGKPKILTLVGSVIIGLGILLILLRVIRIFVNFFQEGGNFFSIPYSLYNLIGAAVGICGFGLAVARGKRWHLFGLLIIIFFGSLVVGLFSMVAEKQISVTTFGQSAESFRCR